MASAEIGIPATCGICSDQCKEPLLLPCLHSSCQSCLDAPENQTANVVHCKACDKSFVTEVSNLPANCFLSRSLSESQEQKVEATVICNQHPNVEAADAMYCKPCRKVICPMFNCIKKQHADHEVKQLQELVAETDAVRQSLRTAASQVSNTLSTSARQASDAVNARLDAQRAQIEEARCSLRKVVDDRVQQIKDQLEQDLQRIVEYEATCEKSCKSRLQELSTETELADRCIAFAEALAKNGNEEDISALSKPVIKSLELLRDKPIQNKPPALGRISHEESEEDETQAQQALRNLLGELSIVHVSGRFSTSNIPKDSEGTVQALSGATASMLVTCRTSDGKTHVSSDNRLCATWEQIPEEMDEQPVVEVNDNNDGTYKLSYTLPKDGKYKLRIAMNGDELGDSPYNFVASCGKWGLDPEQCSKGVSIKDDGKKVVKNALGHSSILGLIGWEQGVQTWRIKVSQKQNCYAGVALRVPEAMTWKGSKSPPVVWCFSSNGYKYSDVGVEGKILGEQDGDVDITLDCDNHTLKMKNLDTGDEDEITDLPAGTKFYPWFHLYYIKTSFSIITDDE
eukprot:scpid47596/ scgid21136/ Tripartite motif-containing protein 3; RING finger protein 22; RING finger protein HAC1